MRLRNDNIYDFFKTAHKENIKSVEEKEQKEKRNSKKYIKILVIRN